MLFDAHWAHVVDELGAHRVPATTEDLLKLIVELFHGYSHYEGLIRAYMVPRHGQELQQANLPKIRKSLEKIVASENGGLDRKRARWAAAILNSLFCVRGWVSLSEDFDMDGEEAAQATVWATSVVLEALKHPAEMSGTRKRKA